LDNIGTSKGLLRASSHRVHVTAVDFTVTEDGKSVSYNHVNVDTIADFATLTNE
jgi:hypothetical protein